jgi:hypothetical protein
LGWAMKIAQPKHHFVCHFERSAESVKFFVTLSMAQEIKFQESDYDYLPHPTIILANTCTSYGLVGYLHYHAQCAG